MIMAVRKHGFVAAFVLVEVLVSIAFSRAEDCAGPSRFDPIVFNSTLYGNQNLADSAWHDDTWAFRRYGHISRLALYKAWYYDGAWHNPGEFKGIQAWHGRYFVTDDTKLLFGAKRPHHPLNCTFYKPEVIVRVELQWDHIMRFMNFTTNLGRSCAWGFPDVVNVTRAVAMPPAPNTYIAALRGHEGKPLPPSLGGYKKRYIVQLGFAWAQVNCSLAQQPELQSNGTLAPTAAAAAAVARAKTPAALQAEGPLAMPLNPTAAAAAAANNLTQAPAVLRVEVPNPAPTTLNATSAPLTASSIQAMGVSIPVQGVSSTTLPLVHQPDTTLFQGYHLTRPH